MATPGRSGSAKGVAKGAVPGPPRPAVEGKGQGKGKSGPPGAKRVWARVETAQCQQGERAIGLPVETTVPSFGDCRAIVANIKFRFASQTSIPDPFMFAKFLENVLPACDGLDARLLQLPASAARALEGQLHSRRAALNILLGSVRRGDDSLIDVANFCLRESRHETGGGVGACLFLSERFRLASLKLLAFALPLDRAVIVLAACLDHEAVGVQTESARLLASISQSHPVMPMLRAMVEDENVEARRQSMFGIAIAASCRDATLVPVVRSQVSDSDPSVRSAAMKALSHVVPLDDPTACDEICAALTANDGPVLPAALSALAVLAQAGHGRAVDCLFSCLDVLASQDEAEPLIKSWWRPLRSSRGALSVAKSLLRAAPADDRRFGPTLAALLHGRHRSWELVDACLVAAALKVQRGDEAVVAAICALLKAYSSPQLVLGERCLRFPFGYREDWDTACAALLNEKLLESGLSLDVIPQERVVIRDVHGVIIQDGSDRAICRPGRERFPITVLFTGQAPAGSFGYVVRRAVGALRDLNGMYLRREGCFRQFLGEGVLFFDVDWKLGRGQPDHIPPPSCVVAGHNSSDAAPPAGNWATEGGDAAVVEVMAVQPGERHQLGHLDSHVLCQALATLSRVAAPGDDRAVDAAYLMQTTNLWSIEAEVRELEALRALAPCGHSDALGSACDRAYHHDAGVREASLELLLALVRPTDMDMIRHRLAHDRGHATRVLQELERKLAGLQPCDTPVAAKGA
eukprot:TRINITY_DN23696_c0_g1_i1.p1 TRINITY_DN23696_c0_g1~~TRINITY_DN23696_c0_g1_i1.p1  ORF type:complete len:767 (+),score=102.73 TRINITY_DN23696_c0_g1_i1:52-2301(+)